MGSSYEHFDYSADKLHANAALVLAVAEIIYGINTIFGLYVHYF